MYSINGSVCSSVLASCYEAYDRLSPAFATFLEGLTALHSGTFFLDVCVIDVIQLIVLH